MNDFQLRQARPSDLSSLDALFARSYPKLLKADYPPSVLATALPIISRAQPHLLSTGTFYVVEQGGQLIGAGGWTARRKLPQLGDIRHVVCDDRHLRKGVASAILRHALETARAAGVRLMDCKATFTAVPFYKSMGFEERARIEVPLAPGIVFPAMRMEQSL